MRLLHKQLIKLLVSVFSTKKNIKQSFSNLTQAQLDFHSLTPHITQEQIDLQNQLEMHTTNLITKPLSIDSPVLFLDTNDLPTISISSNDQMEHQPISSKNKTPSDHNISPETPPPTKKKYEIMKDPAVL